MSNITIKQIAEMAGVSRGTVDRALNNRGGVNPEVEERIKKIASELEYTPNLIAKALANSKRKLNICVLLNSGENPFFIPVIKGINAAAAEILKYGVSVTIKPLTGYDPEQQLKALCEIEESKPEGLVLTPINDKEIVAKLLEIGKENTTIVTLTSDVAGIDKLCFVGCNYQKSGQTAAEILGQIMPNGGKAGIVTGSFNMTGHKSRIEGFKSVISGNYAKIQVVSVVEGKDNDEIAYQKTKEMLLDYDLDALYFCAGGIDGGITAVKELKKAPKIITVDDASNIAKYLREGVINATVCQEPFKQGYQSVMLLFDKLVNGKKPPRRHIYTNNEIKVKYNCD